MQRAIAILLVVVTAAGCKTTTGTVVGTIAGASAVAGYGALLSTEQDSSGMAVGGLLIALSTIAQFAALIVEVRHDRSQIARGAVGEATAFEPVASSPVTADQGVGAASHTVGPANQSVGAANQHTYDRTGAYAGRVTADGNYYDRAGAYDGRRDGSTFFDRSGAQAGRVDEHGNYYDRSGSSAGRIDDDGSIYDRTGASAGRIDDSGNIYDRTGAYAGRVDGACDDACKRATAGRLLTR